MLALVGNPTRREVWRSLPTELGPGARVASAIEDSRIRTDIAVLGTSGTSAAFPYGALDKAVGARLKRPTKVDLLSLKWQGYDLQYALLNEYLANKKPRLLLIQLPGKETSTNTPHRQAFRWLGWNDENRAIFSIAGPRERVGLFASTVLGTPRRVLSRIRPNLISSDELTDAGADAALSRFRRVGFEGGKYVMAVTRTASPRTGSWLWRARDPIFKYEPAPGGPRKYMLSFIAEIGRLAVSHGVPVALVHYPELSEVGRFDIPLAVNAAAVFGPSTPVIAIPSGRLFVGLDREEAKKFYSDSRHFNTNGASAFLEPTSTALAILLNKSGWFNK